MSDIDFFADLGPDDFGAELAKPVKAAAKSDTFPCEHCNGSGVWRGGRNSKGESKCFACGGRGWFKTSASDRMAKRVKAAQNKREALANAQDAFDKSNPGLIDELRGMTSWNSFAQSLTEQYDRKGALSDKQVVSAARMIAKTAATKAKRAAEKAAATVAVDLDAIRQMFAKAAESGLKRPTYRAEGLIISRAPDHGKNAGALYVKTASGDYQGKIQGREFNPAYSAAPETTTALQAIAKDPAEAAIRYGRLTGSCSCCGRELTNKVSIENGIGPVCATKFGF